MLTWKEYCNSLIWSFPKSDYITEEEYQTYKLNRIYPLKQKQVADILKLNLTNVEYFYIFGSSKDNSCTSKSDLDIAIRFKDNDDKKILELLKEIDYITEYNYDFINLNKQNSEALLNNIYKGVRFNV